MGEKKNLGGAPTKYKPEYCDLVQEIGAEGGWVSEMAEACDVSRTSFYDWEKARPEFKEALARAKQKSQAYYEKTGRLAMFSKEFNANLWIKQMQGRFKDDYTENRNLNHSSPDGSMTPNITINKTYKSAKGDEKNNT